MECAYRFKMSGLIERLHAPDGKHRIDLKYPSNVLNLQRMIIKWNFFHSKCSSCTYCLPRSLTAVSLFHSSYFVSFWLQSYFYRVWIKKTPVFITWTNKFRWKYVFLWTLNTFKPSPLVVRQRFIATVLSGLKLI